MVAKLQLSSLGRIYVFAVVAAGVLAIGHSAHHLIVDPAPLQWLILAAFTLISGTLTIRVPSMAATISVSEMFVFTAVILFGPAPATVIVALDGLILSVSSRSRQLHRILFNVAEPSVSIWIASSIFFALAGIKPLSAYTAPPHIARLLGPLALLAAIYFLINSWLMAVAIGFEKRQSPLDIWRGHFVWLSLNYFSGASVAILLVHNSGGTVDPIGFAVIIPLLFVSYLTYKYSMGRMEDAAQHIEQLNLLYLSTIKTLAMAIDAKDQITHGHIRRVQLYAVGLARSLGIHEEPMLKAIEAAALLHDTGKLAVPEYILNKPGKLTPAEFEKMKLHATVGADILSSIDFPYPVVPIVRHHHENWDGTGYPGGLKGPDIPMGARILAVVDCFDALTSDRPYRPKLGDADALQILLDRRGSMYDPLVVDTFMKVYADIKTEEDDVQPESSGLNEITRSTKTPDGAQIARLDDIAASSDEMLTLYDIARALGGRTGLADAGDIIAKHLRRILPASLCIFYVFESASDELVAAHVSGAEGTWFDGIRIPIGQRISGWVAANRRTIVNSDPVLDLGDVARSAKSRLRSCLSTPLIADETLVGVLTLYSSNVSAFTEDHRRIVEAVGRQISRVVRHSAEFERERSAFKDTLTGLPNLERLRQLSPADVGVSAEACAQPLSLLFIDVDRLKQVNDRAGRNAGDAVLAHVARSIRRVLRGGDILFRYMGDEFVVLLSQTDSPTAETIANRVHAIIKSSPFALSDGSTLRILVTIGIATHPSDGVSLTDLIATAQQRLVAVVRTSGETAPGVH